MECGEVMGTGAALGQGPSASAALTDNPQARLTVVVEVERTRSGPKETCCPMLLLEGAKSICLFRPGPVESQVDMGWAGVCVKMGVTLLTPILLTGTMHHL